MFAIATDNVAGNVIVSTEMVKVDAVIGIVAGVIVYNGIVATVFVK